MKPGSLILGVFIAALLVGAGGTPTALPDSNPPTPSQLKAKIRQQANRIASLNDQIDAQDALISDQIDTITRLRTRVANQPDPLDAVLARGPDGLWNAIVAISGVFPTRDPGALCGYDRDYTPGNGPGLTLTSYSFYKLDGC